MTQMAIQATGSVVANAPLPTGSGGAIAAGASLLPPASTAFDIGDALTEIMKLSSALSEEQTKGSMNTAESASKARKAAADKRMQAINDAVEAARKAAEEKSSGGLFDCITDNLGPAGLLGLCTGAAYIVAADVVAHAVGLEDEKVDLADAAGVGAMMTGPVGVLAYGAQLAVKRYGPEEIQKVLDGGPTVTDEQTRLANKLAFSITQAHLALAATIATGGTAAPAVVACVGIAISTTTQILQETGALQEAFGEDAKWVALGGTIAGAALNIGGGIAAIRLATPLAALVITAKCAAAGLEAGHNIDQGIRNLRAADYAKDSDYAHIDAQQQKHVLELVERMVETVIDDMKSIKESAQKTTEILQGSTQTNNQTLLLAGTMKA